MNMKILIETLIQIPDKQLLAELNQEIAKHKSLIVPDIKRFFIMLRCLFSGSDKQIKIKAIQLYRKTFQFLLKTEVELSWNQVSLGVIRMSGEEDAEIRKFAKDLMIQIIDTANNANIVMQKLYYEGLENESVLVMISSMKNIFHILELYPSILQNKTSIRIVKLVLQKLIAISIASKHIELCKNAKEFLQKLFYLKIQKLDDVLTLMNQKVLQHLQSLWVKNKERMLQRDKQEQQKQKKHSIQIKYEHLPLINGKFFAVYQPYILKNIFNPQTQQGKYLAIKHFQEQFENHYDQLNKYINVIFKVILKFIDERHYDLILMLKKIVCSPGINNIVNLSMVPSIVVNHLDTQNVPYRRQLRSIFQKLHYEIPKQCLRAYQEEFQNNNQMNWIQIFEITSLTEHWIDNNMQASYPPTLDKMLGFFCHNLHSLQPKVKQKSLDVLLIILDRYPGYRQNLQDHFTQDKISEIQDAIEGRKNKGRGTSVSQQAQQIFIKQYKEERDRFIKHAKIGKK